MVEPEVGPQVAVDEEEQDWPFLLAVKNSADGENSGKPHGCQGGASHAIRKHRAVRAGA